MSFEGALLEREDYGMYVKTISVIRDGMRDLSVSRLARLTSISEDECKEAIQTIKANPDMDDHEVASEVNWAD